jgi:eukaryotic-like serine/threonine-protein kinase
MTTALDHRASAIFLSLSTVPPEDRARYLDAHCGDDAALRRLVERLLDAVGEDDTSVRPLDRIQREGHEGGIRPGTTIGDFIVVRQIGAGGAGVVYLAHQQHPPRIVALKVLRGEFVASDLQRRFEFEAELLAELHHPGIAQIFAASPGDGVSPPFIAMELVDGPPITEHVEAQGLSSRERIDLFVQVCDAVQHAHQRGVIHRDLKPGNILVGQDRQAKVLDFGVARRVEMTTVFPTETGQLVGTLAYMSPEQVQAVPGTVDTRTDIHALGVILFRLLAGRLPFAADDPSLPELARRIVEDEPPKLGALDPAFRGDLEVIVARALAKEKDRRYASAAGLAADLRRYLSGNPISASADSAWYLVRRQVRRYRLALALSGAGLVLVGGLASYALMQRNRADAVNVQLQQELSTSTLERARLLSMTGNHPGAEELAWTELFRRPDSDHARWALWEIYSRQPVLWTRVHEGGAESVHFSRDGRRLVTAGRTHGDLQIVDTASGQPLHRIVSEPKAIIARARFTPDGRQVVAASQTGPLRFWNSESARHERDIGGPFRSLRDFVFTDDGRTVVAVADGALHGWSVENGAPIAGLAGLFQRAIELGSHERGTLVAVGDSDGGLTIMDVRHPERRRQIPAHDRPIVSVAVSQDGQYIATGTTDGQVGVWNAATGSNVRRVRTHNGRVRGLAFSADRNSLAVPGEWGTRLWNLDEELTPLRDVGGSEGVSDATVSADGQFLATCSGGSGRVRLWHLTADMRVRHWQAHQTRVTAVALSDSTPRIITAGDSLVALDANTPAQRMLSEAGSVAGIVRSRDSQWIATAGTGKWPAVWRLSDLQRLSDLTEAAPSRGLILADDDRRLIVGRADGALRMFDMVDGRPENGRTIPPAGTEVLAMASQAARVFIAHRAGGVLVRDVRTGDALRTLHSAASPFAVAASPRDDLLAIGTYVGTVELWNPTTGTRLHELKGLNALVSALAFSPDGAMLAASSRDGTTRLWSADGQFLAVVARRTPAASRTRFSPDGRQLIIGYDDGEVEIRDLQYFFRYAGGQAEYQLGLLTAKQQSFPRASEILEWARRVRQHP